MWATYSIYIVRLLQPSLYGRLLGPIMSGDSEEGAYQEHFYLDFSEALDEHIDKVW